MVARPQGGSFFRGDCVIANACCSNVTWFSLLATKKGFMGSQGALQRGKTQSQMGRWGWVV